jgi:galactokinase/mevalonate kinase-like predicted kinase
MHESWDLLILTAATERQGENYRRQLALRQRLGRLAGVRQVRVVVDPPGGPVGSGTSTLHCLREVVDEFCPHGDAEQWRRTLAGLRILIVHGGGDLPGIPAYQPAGGALLPLPVAGDSALAPTLLDLQLPRYLDLPQMPAGTGQICVASGDVLLDFEPAGVRFAPRGVTGLAVHDSPSRSREHGVFCPGEAGHVRRFLQKPADDELQRAGAIDRFGRVLLDIGLLNLDAVSAARLLELTAAGPPPHGLNLYREICSALGAETARADYLRQVRRCGSTCPQAQLERLYELLHPLPMSVHRLDRCKLLHPSTMRGLLETGRELLAGQRGLSRPAGPMLASTEVLPGGQIRGGGWVEGCRIGSDLTLADDSAVIGADLHAPLAIPPATVLDVLAGRDDEDRPVRFVRAYGLDDSLHAPLAEGASLCGRSLPDWMAAMDAEEADLWPADTPAKRRTVWAARLFPAVAEGEASDDWHPLADPAEADAQLKRRWKSARRWSFEAIARLADPEAFWHRRRVLNAESLLGTLRWLFRWESEFSAADLALLLESCGEPARAVSGLLAEAMHFADGRPGGAREAFVYSRILHSLSTAVQTLAEADGGGPAHRRVFEVLGGEPTPEPAAKEQFGRRGLRADAETTVEQWTAALRREAFAHQHRTILTSAATTGGVLRCRLRADEIVWARAPARIDLAGGWSDTPPYALEHGGIVLNAAIDLNGQPPIQCYCRRLGEPMIRVGSIDLGEKVEIRTLEDLQDYRQARGSFSLVKAALAISGFEPGPEEAGPGGLAARLEAFGGGLELTTLAAIPKGSGLGTSSIVAAAIYATIQRVFGRTCTPDELFHGVLRIEQALTTGGGWQDQVGGAVGGVKIASADAALVPHTRIHYLLGDLLDRRKGSPVLLYYTGITRLAKNVLQRVVGHYLDRDRRTMRTLRRIRELPERTAEALSQRDLAAFGRRIREAWELNKELEPGSSNEAVEALMARIEPFVYGAKLLGAGGGGFCLMICRDDDHARRLREILESEPPNPLARFFEMDLSEDGLVVTAC